MSKKVKEPSTPESRAEKLANKQMLRKVFANTFFKAFCICLAALLAYSAFVIAFVHPNRMQVAEPDPNTASNAVVQNNNNNTNTPAASDDAATPAVTEITADSSDEQKLAYFNTVMNKIKPGAKQITFNKEINSQVGSLETSIKLPGSIQGIADGLIKSNMGQTDLSKLDPAMVNATTEDAKNNMFPVEKETWSSKLKMDNINSITMEEAGDKYNFVIKVKDDAPSANTAHGVGNCGQAISVVLPQTIKDNAGGAAGIISNIQTGMHDAVIKVTVDKATGNVVSANYYYVWTLKLTAAKSIDVTINFGQERDYSIAW